VAQGMFGLTVGALAAKAARTAATPAPIAAAAPPTAVEPTHRHALHTNQNPGAAPNGSSPSPPSSCLLLFQSALGPSRRSNHRR